MTELVRVSLENEMDLSLAYKRSIATLATIGLTLSTQTTFATAVSEVCREVIDKTSEGNVKFGIELLRGRYLVVAEINYTSNEYIDLANPGIDYAKKLVPILELARHPNGGGICLKLGIPNTAKIDPLKIASIKVQIEEEGPISAYEEVKLRNAVLTDIKQQQEVALEQADHMDKLKTEFLSVASHELNSPLTVLLGLSQIAKNKSSESITMQNILTKVEDQTKKIILLVRQLMDVSKFEHGIVSYDYQITPIQHFFASIKDNMFLLAPKHNLTYTIEAEGNFFVDVLRLEQVITNLLNNAVKYSAQGTEISLSCAVKENQLCVTVTDSGMGMSAETQQQVFEKFFRDKNVEAKYGGLGMGLFIVNRIVTDHKGQIEVKSKLGEGSSFSFFIPLHLD